METAVRWIKLPCFGLTSNLFFFEGAQPIVHHTPKMPLPPKTPDMTLERIFLQEKKESRVLLGLHLNLQT